MTPGLFLPWVLVICLTLSGHSHAAPDGRHKELSELRNRIAELREEVERASEDRKEAADGLRESEQRISAVNRALHELRQRERRLSQNLQQLDEERVAIEARLTEQRGRLAALLRQHHRQGDADPLRLLLSGRDPAEVQRDLGYYGYIGRARAALIAQHRSSLASLAEITEQTRQRQAELDGVRQSQLEQRQQLSAEKQARETVFKGLSAQIRKQRQEIDSLVRDEQRLARLIEKLRRLAEAEKARKAAQARKAAESRKSAPGQATGTPDKPGQVVDRVADASLARYAFTKLRGKLALPTAGEIVARFGQAREDGGPNWKGLFIRTKSGQPVRAVGNGEVVFSDWLRGFGNLLIVDHGEGYLSLYSNNESLYKQAGDPIRAGDVIAATGNTGGHASPGLYFELRRQGQPFDPMTWVK